MADADKKFKEFAERVEDEGDLTTFTLGKLREALDYSKLGPRVLKAIDEALAGAGLGYFPRSVLENTDSPRAADVLRVYRKGSTLGSIIDAVLFPSTAGDDTLRGAAEDDARATLEKIRTLLEA